MREGKREREGWRERVTQAQGREGEEGELGRQRYRRERGTQGQAESLGTQTKGGREREGRGG